MSQVWHGIQVVLRHNAQSWAHPRWARPGAESLDELTERAVDALTDIVGGLRGRTAVIGSHGTFIARALIGSPTGGSADRGGRVLVEDPGGGFGAVSARGGDLERVGAVQRGGDGLGLVRARHHQDDVS